MKARARLPFIGTQLFCPDCHRLLVAVQSDGEIDIAGKAEVRGSAAEQMDENGQILPPDGFVVTQAICHLRRCRARRWFNDKRRRK